MPSIFRGHLSPPLQQRGMATILIIMLMGLALTVTALGVMYSVRTSQEQQITVHAATHSQAGVWAAAEAVRLYLNTLDETTLKGFNPEKPLKFNLNENPVTAKVSPLTPSESGNTAPRRIHAEISYFDTVAKATSTLEVVYNIIFSSGGSGGNGDNGGDNNNVLSFATDMSITGNIKVLGSDAAIFNVDGNVNLGGASITGIKTINANGDITIGSGIKVDNLYANGNITLTGSANVLTASSLKDITINSSGTKGILNANGNITITNGSVTTANALGFITATSGGATHGTFTAGKTIAISNGSLSSANAVGNIDITNWPKVATARSEGTITCPSVNWKEFSSIQAKVSTKNCAGQNVSAPSPVSITTMLPITKLTLTKPKVDAYNLKESANYVFQREGSKTKVSVRDINNIPNGDYYIGKYTAQNNDRVDYLCKEVSDSGICSEPISYIDSQTICQGNSYQNACFSFNNGTWVVEGKNLAPGIMWFEGNLTLKNGNFYNTFIATGNIETSGSHVTTSINYAGYKTICLNQYPKNPTDRFKNLYPTNFCKGTTLINNSIGNIALLAGGYDATSTFNGGIISLGSSTEIFGSVISGHSLGTGGNTTIHGYVTAAGQGSGSVSPFGGSTTIDLQNLPPGYNPGNIPNMGGGNNQNPAPNEPDTGTVDTAEILWSRYL